MAYKRYPLTEKLVELAIERANNPERILDLCCGDGWIARKLKDTFPEAEVWASDIRTYYLIRHAHRQINWGIGDMFEPVNGEFDLIVCNPPHLSEAEWQVAKPEPKIAFSDETFLPRFLKEFKDYLTPGGLVCMEINPAWEPLLEGWELVEVDEVARFAIYKHNK